MIIGSLTSQYLYTPNSKFAQKKRQVTKTTTTENKNHRKVNDNYDKVSPETTKGKRLDVIA